MITNTLLIVTVILLIILAVPLLCEKLHVPSIIGLILAGILGTSRMILRQHSLAQVVAGFLVGVVCAIIGILFL